jgi:hypothetical protein
MKSVRMAWLVSLGVGLAAGAWAVSQTWAAHCGGSTGKSCTEDIRETKHNLAANTDVLASGTTEVCVCGGRRAAVEPRAAALRPVSRVRGVSGL